MRNYYLTELNFFKKYISNLQIPHYEFSSSDFSLARFEELLLPDMSLRRSLGVNQALESELLNLIALSNRLYSTC